MSAENRKRIALVLPDLGFGGAEDVALRLASDWMARGHEVDIVLMEEKGEFLEIVPPGARLFDLRAPRIRSALLPLVSYLRERKPDAMQVSMWPLTIIGLLAAKIARSRARVVVSEHIALSKEYPLGGLRSFILRKSLAWIYPWAAARVAVSQDAAQDLSRISGLPRESVDVIYNPVSALENRGSPPEPIDPIWGEGRRILTVGRLTPQKNHALLIRAFAEVRKTVEASLIILGEGPLRPELEALARQANVERDVLFPGFVLDPGPYYKSADLFVLSSDYEGFGLVLVEAMQCGLPVVSTDCEAGPREILADGEFGTLVPCDDVDALANAIREALDEAADEEKSRARAAMFTGEGASDRYLELLLSE